MKRKVRKVDLRRIINADVKEYDIILEKLPERLLEVIFYQKNLVLAMAVTRFNRKNCLEKLEDVKERYMKDKKEKTNNVDRIKNIKFFNEIKEGILHY